MRAGGGFGPIFLAALLLPAALVWSQYQPPAQSLLIHGSQASTWTQDGDNVVQIAGPVVIELDRTKMSAEHAVVWLRDVRGGQPGEQAVTVALMGNAEVVQPKVTRSGGQLIVNARVNGQVRITAEKRTAQDLTDSPTYQLAMAMRKEVEQRRPQSATTPAAMPDEVRPTHASTQPTAPPRTGAPVRFRAGQIQSVATGDGKMALALSGGIALTREDANGDRLEMQADRAVVFTTLERLRDARDLQAITAIEQAITGAYLEGDVRVTGAPADELKSEQRLRADRIYYDFTTDRAVLTNAVLQMVEPQLQIPIVVRAETVRQLSQGEYSATDAELTTSTFAVPSYSVRSDRIYVRQEESRDERMGTRTHFSASDVTFRAFDVPVFYLPAVGGSLTEQGFPLRALSFGSSENFGTSVETRWGLLETLGAPPPRDFDASFTLDYFSERGPAGGLDIDYSGGFISRATRDAWNFQGEFESYLVYDEGTDDLGRRRGEVEPPRELRGRIEWEHQHFFPDDWQLQVRSGWVSDATFLEEWFENDFNEGLPLETSLYLKKQRDSEAVTFLTSIQPNNVVTTADLQQEQFEIQRMPEIGYHRIGESFASDKLTFYSANTVGLVEFNESGTSLEDQGFRFGQNVIPGQPSLGVVGVPGAAGPPDVPEDANLRGDFRQEIDYPVSVGQFRVVPYLFGRYTGYDQAIDGERADRLMGGTGVRFNTQFWKVDNHAHSELFDIHRVRHVIEPEVHLFASATNFNPNELWIYDEPIDKTYGVTAAQLALRQRWQTKRGGPGRLRSVDFFTLNLEANFFGNQPSEAELVPAGFRGLFFRTLPEASVPRDSINANAEWRISDSTIALADAQYNMDQERLATASVGLIARRDTRMTYFLGLRYIEDLNSSIGTVAANYELTRKYSVGFQQSYDFRDEGGVYSSINVQRRFDRFFMMFSIYDNSDDDEQGIGFALYPEGLAGASTQQMGRFFGGN